MLAIAFFCLDNGFKLVTAFRGTGFRDLLAAEHPYELVDEDLRQSGLNMIQELCFANAYLESGAASPSYGGRYLNELLNVVPRVIWPSKPLVGIDYAKWRGLEDPQSDLGVSATISTGMIGGGILNFGPLFGPVAAGIIMALWATTKFAFAPHVVHAGGRSYIQPRSRHHSAGALACRICVLFCSSH